jgi:transcriptional regulator with XRE-family HTH domain
MNQTNCPREYDFALVLNGVPELTTEVENALFSAGCDDATFSIQYGHLYAEFSRVESSLQDAILSAIHDVQTARIGAEVLRVDECNLVTQAEIARRIGRSRQMVFQYISGQRGPGNFPPPECHLSEKAPLWAWCAVSYWLAQNNIIRPEESWNAEVVAAINNYLEAARQQERYPDLVRQIAEKVGSGT